MSLAEYQDKFRRLVVNTAAGRASPHKLCMLLALLDLARSGGLPNNRIQFGLPLLERYLQFFAAVRTPGDHPNPYFPFFHLTGKLRDGQPSFWHLRPLPGRERAVEAMRTARSFPDITNSIAYAQVDAELFELLQDVACIDALEETISVHWLDHGLQEMRAVVNTSGKVSLYERTLRRGEAVSSGEPLPPPYIRDPAFRRVVTELYDYRCAATGLRVISVAKRWWRLHTFIPSAKQATTIQVTDWRCVRTCIGQWIAI